MFTRIVFTLIFSATILGSTTASEGAWDFFKGKKSKDKAQAEPENIKRSYSKPITGYTIKIPSCGNLEDFPLDEIDSLISDGTINSVIEQYFSQNLSKWNEADYEMFQKIFNDCNAKVDKFFDYYIDETFHEDVADVSRKLREGRTVKRASKSSGKVNSDDSKHAKLKQPAETREESKPAKVNKSSAQNDKAKTIKRSSAKQSKEMKSTLRIERQRLAKDTVQRWLTEMKSLPDSYENAVRITKERSANQEHLSAMSASSRSTALSDIVAIQDRMLAPHIQKERKVFGAWPSTLAGGKASAQWYRAFKDKYEMFNGVASVDNAIKEFFARREAILLGAQPEFMAHINKISLDINGYGKADKLYKSIFPLSEDIRLSAHTEYEKIVTTKIKAINAFLAKQLAENKRAAKAAKTAKFEKLAQAAEQGNGDAQAKLGGMYYEGNGVNRDYAKAFKWLSKGAKSGHVKAQHRLGYMYHTGEGVAQNDVKAAVWYRKAANQGYATSQYNLGLAYNNGQGVQQNYNKAFRWFKKAAVQGYASAQYNLGLYYYKGLGTRPNVNLADEWWRKAAAQGHTGAINNRLYIRGW